VYQISPHLQGLYNPELEGKGASTWQATAIKKVNASVTSRQACPKALARYSADF
jgi:hypothetical protein